VGKKVNVVLWDGTVKSVDEETARGLDPSLNRQETSGENLTRAVQQRNEEESAGLEEGGKAAAEGLLDAVSFGGFGKLIEHDDPEWAENMRARGQNRPGARLFGEGVGYLTGVGAVGGAQAAGKAVEGAIGGGLGRVAGLGAEGALFGVGGEVAHTNVTGDPLTIEAAVESAGVGGLLNVGLGVLGDRLKLVGARAKAAIVTEQREAQAAADTLQRAQSLSTPPSSWDDFHVAAKESQARLKRDNKRILSAAEDYADAIKPDNVNSAIGEVQKLRTELQSRINGTAYGRKVTAAKRAATTAQNAYEKELGEYTRFTTSSKQFPRMLREFDDAITEIADRYGGESDLMAQMQANEPAPTIAGKVKEYREQLSRASKLKAGGYDADYPPRWNPDGTQVSNVDAAMQELHDLRGKLQTYTRVEVPDLPRIPEKPAGYTAPEKSVEDYIDTSAMTEVSRDLSNTIEKAREFARAKDGASAIAELRAAEARITSQPGFGDLAFPELPAPASAPKEFTPVAIPKSLKEFSRMGADRARLVGELANRDPVVAEKFQTFMNDMGLELREGAAENVAATHQTLGEYLRAAEGLKRGAESTGEKAGLGALLRKWGKRGVMYSAARAADMGGWKGAFLRTTAGSAVGYALDGVEGAYIGATLTAGKLSLRDKIRGVVSKIGQPLGRGLRELGPVTAWLGASFIDGSQDPEKDTRQLAVNRIQEILGARYSAPDTLYTALEPLMGTPGDVAWKLHNHALGAINHLADRVPLDPGLDITPSGSKWTPEYSKALELAHRIEAVQDPLRAVARTIAGDGHQAATETLWLVYPALMGELASEAATNASTLKMSYEQGSTLSQLFRTPMTGLQEQVVVTAIQGLYLTQPQQVGGQGTPSPSPGRAGRPAAVRSPVAGSSVSAILSSQ